MVLVGRAQSETSRGPLPVRVRVRTEGVCSHPATPVPRDTPITSEQFLDGFTQFELVPTPVC